MAVKLTPTRPPRGELDFAWLPEGYTLEQFIDRCCLWQEVWLHGKRRGWVVYEMLATRRYKAFMVHFGSHPWRNESEIDDALAIIGAWKKTVAYARSAGFDAIMFRLEGSSRLVMLIERMGAVRKSKTMWVYRV